MYMLLSMHEEFCYYGPVVLRDYLSVRYYNHFMKLFYAVRLAYSDKYVGRIALIDRLFEDYVEEFKELYGSAFMTSNVLNLLHIAEDVQRFGPLSTISAYPFESYLGRLKSIVRAGKNPLMQIAFRLIERSNIDDDDNDKNHNGHIMIKTKGSKSSVTIPERHFMLCNHRIEDQWFLADGKVTKMVGVVQVGPDVFIEGAQLTTSFSDFKKIKIKKSEEGDECTFIPILHTEI